jgi:mannan endo-1,4-beta-mannosidase
MKKMILLPVIFIALVSCNSGQSSKVATADQKATKETQSLLVLLKDNINRGIMFGHQDDLSYGRAWDYPNGESDVKRVCSDYPAITGIDLGHLELDSLRNLDSVPFKYEVEIVKKVHSYGGLITVSWHQNNPLTGGTAWDVSSDKVVESVLPGGSQNEKYKQWLDKVAAFVSSFTDESGKPIPVIFRPYHEHTGSWFWWGQKLCTTQQFIDLWRFTFDYLTKTKNVHNLLFAYSSSGDFTNAAEYLERYPGDDYVDIIGFDYYQYSVADKEKTITGLNTKLGLLESIGKEHNKIPALTEVGFESLPDPTWWKGTIWPAIKDHKISWFLVWRNAHYRIDHFYAPYPGQKSEKDFIDFYNLPGSLFSKDLGLKKSK